RHSGCRRPCRRQRGELRAAAPAAGGARSVPRMADGELSPPLSPRLHPDPRHAWRPRLRLAMGNADEGHRADGLDDRTPVRDRLREARPQQAALETDDGSFRETEAKRAAVEFVLGGFNCAIE